MLCSSPANREEKKESSSLWPKLLGSCSVASEATSGAQGTAWVPTEAGYKSLGVRRSSRNFFVKCSVEKIPEPSGSHHRGCQQKARSTTNVKFISLLSRNALRVDNAQRLQKIKQVYFFIKSERDAAGQRPTPSKNKVSFPARPRYPQHSMLEMVRKLKQKLSLSTLKAGVEKGKSSAAELALVFEGVDV